MSYLRKIAGILIIFAVMSGGLAYADYQFDDLLGPSGVSYQWMMLNNGGETFGAKHAVAIDVSGDILTTGDAILEVQNGDSASTITDRNLHTFFFVLTDGHGEFDMNFRSPTMSFDVATSNIGVDTSLNENSTYYYDTKTANGRPEGDYDALWRNYSFSIDRNREGRRYDTVAQYFYFQQNPHTAPSQGIPRPMVISNVSSGTATDEPLELRMTLRDTPNMNGNIVAYTRDTWSVEDNKTVDADPWVFVPVDDLNVGNMRINYYLTTEVVNHTSVRYMAIPYDSYGSWEFPTFWKFDLPRYQGTTYIESNFQLAPLSHIAPGLVSVYQRPFDVNENMKRPLRIKPIDDNRGTGTYDLLLSHRIVYGKRLGDTYKQPANVGTFNFFEITAYQPNPADNHFYDNVAKLTGADGKKIATPTTSIFTANSVNQGTNPSSRAIQYFTVNQNIPGNLRSSSSEGMLPMHITINIPVTLINNRTWWNNLVDEWRSSGHIEDTFADSYELYLMAEDNNIWNLSQELREKGLYNDQLKVFFDEDRGRITQDNYRGVITVSFIAMLLDGTRDGVRPELSIVSDDSVDQENKYIVIRDGKLDNKWNMTFFIAPAGFFENPGSERNNNANSGSTGGGGGGCSAGMLGIIGLAVVFMKRKAR
ncbi:MAG: hypothetical protein IJU48_00010 [Synergistaceae bacterium]|nr:hypothetical protein [Synergistaceae bacterium]